jgi:peptidyl-prolyl cis-trans isomerase B (cyclophilin B)
VPTSKQRRETARRRLERQIQRRQEAAAKRRRRNLITAAALGVVVVLGGVWLIVAQLGGNSKQNAAAATPSAAPTTPAPTPAHAPRTSKGPCQYAETVQTLTNPDAKDVGLPPDPKPTPSKGTVPVTLTTTQGKIVITLDRAKAPCAVQSFLYLTGKKFFDNSPCPRVTGPKDRFSVLQCGDPSGTTGGGPTYQYKEENLAKANYVKGVVAMAKGSQPKSTNSQFFIIWADAKTLPKNYSVIGTVTEGMNVVEKVGKAGNDGSNQAGGGKPTLPITIKTARVTG